MAADPEYIARAVNFYREWHYNHRNTKLIFLGLGNHFTWNKENFPKSSDVFVLQPYSQGVDLCVLSMCKDVIMTVGTYGWWGAYMSGGSGIYMKNCAQPNSSFELYDLVREDHFLPRWIPM